MDQIMAGDAGLEPTHARVKVWCLTNLANPQNSWSIGVPEGSRTPDTRLRRAVLYPAELQAHNLKNGAGEGNRTLAICLEGRGSTTELHPHIGGGSWIRTSEGAANRFTVCPL